MGGSGSGNWYRWDKKTTVEECRWLDAARWQREGILAPEHYWRGGWVWTNAHTGEQTASIGYAVDTTDMARPSVRLFYTITRRTGEKIACDYEVPLTTTVPNYGGLRWWFICPLVVGDYACRRRVQKLYLPPGGRHYGCRHCYDLTYTSCQDSHKDDGVWKMLARDTGVHWKGIRYLMKQRGWV